MASSYFGYTFIILFYIRLVKIFGFGNGTYCLLTERRRFPEAIQVCSSLGMKLVQIQTLEKWNSVLDFMAPLQVNGNPQPWVHLNYVGFWRWGDGTNFTIPELWSDKDKSKGPKQHCAKIMNTNLYSANCSWPKIALCEYDSEANLRGFYVDKYRKDVIPTIMPITELSSGSHLYCLERCLRNSQCVSYAITSRSSCLLYDSVVTSGFISLSGATYYLKPCLL